MYLNFGELSFISPSGSVDLYGASLLGGRHPQDAVQEAGGLLRALLLILLGVLLGLGQKAGAIHCQSWGYTRTEKQPHVLHGVRH